MQVNLYNGRKMVVVVIAQCSMPLDRAAKMGKIVKRMAYRQVPVYSVLHNFVVATSVSHTYSN